MIHKLEKLTRIVYRSFHTKHKRNWHVSVMESTEFGAIAQIDAMLPRINLPFQEGKIESTRVRIHLHS